MNDKKSERRKYLRCNVTTKLNFQVQSGEKAETLSEKVSGTTKNISIEGICFTSGEKLEPGTKLELEVFLLPELKPLCLGGEVRWSRPVQAGESKTTFDTGVQLFTINKDDENKFIKYVCKKMTESIGSHLHI